MNSCVVYGCTNNSTHTDATIQYYYFPKHALIAQHWVTACWRPDTIDTNTAQICSIHFDNTCYTSEYKMDYLGNYTKILKYDAVPNLYLPNPQAPLIIKTIDEANVTITTEHIDPSEIKEIMVYEVQTLPDPNFAAAELKRYITINTQPITVDEKPSTIALQEAEIENDDRYKHITTRQQLQQTINSNNTFKRKCDELKIVVKQLREKIDEKEKEVKSLDEELKKISQQCDTLHRTTMNVADQKTILSKVFSESQIKILSGKKKIYWSNDDMAMGYTIRHLSNKRCYMYLSKNLNIPLPALSSIKRWSTLKKNEFKEETKKKDCKFEDEDTE